jgi:hypothetical protein
MISPEDLAALRGAVLRSHDEFLRMEPKPQSVRMHLRLKRLHLSWLAVPWIVVDIARMFLPALWGRFPVSDERAVSLYRRLSGKDPQVARAEVWRIGGQLHELDERLRDPYEQRPAAPRGADPAELEAALDALLGYYLAGRRTDDELLAEVEAAWAESEELTQQQLEHAMERGAFRRRRRERTVDEQVEEQLHAAADRYRVAWRRWLDSRGP